MPENDLTDHDLARLTIFLTVHKGHLSDVPHGGIETHKRFAAAGLATLTEEPYEIPNGCDVHNYVSHESRITQLGTRVAEAMLLAAREALTVVEMPGPPGRFICPRCGSTRWGSSNCTGPIEQMTGHCSTCQFSWPRTDDAKYWRTDSR